MEDPVVPLERKLYGHLLAGLLWERQFEKILLHQLVGGWARNTCCVCSSLHAFSLVFALVHVFS